MFFCVGWTKSGEDSGKTVKGTFEIPNLSEEHTPKDVDINVELTGDTSNTAFAVKNFMRVKGAELIREKLGLYITNLKSGMPSQIYYMHGLLGCE